MAAKTKWDHMQNNMCRCSHIVKIYVQCKKKERNYWDREKRRNNFVRVQFLISFFFCIFSTKFVMSSLMVIVYSISNSAPNRVKIMYNNRQLVLSKIFIHAMIRFNLNWLMPNRKFLALLLLVFFSFAPSIRLNWKHFIRTLNKSLFNFSNSCHKSSWLHARRKALLWVGRATECSRPKRLRNNGWDTPSI